MTKSYADQCLERAEKATEGPWVGDEFEMCAPKAAVFKPGNVRLVWADDYHMNEWDAEFIAHSRTDVPELARRLNKACYLLKLLGDERDHDIPRWINELEAMPGG